MRIGYPGMMRAAQMGGLMQGMNQSTDRAMKYDQMDKQRASEEMRAAADLALRERDLSQTGSLANRRLGLDERMGMADMADKGLRTGLMGRELDLRQSAQGDENARFNARLGFDRDEAAAQRTFSSGEAERGRTFTAGQSAEGRRHDLRMNDESFMNARSLEAIRDEAARRRMGAGGWERSANADDAKTAFERQKALADLQNQAAARMANEGRAWDAAGRAQEQGQRMVDRGIAEESDIFQTLLRTQPELLRTADPKALAAIMMNIAAMRDAAKGPTKIRVGY